MYVCMSVSECVWGGRGGGVKLDLRADTQQDICVKEIGLQVQSLLTILDSIVHTIGAQHEYSFKESPHMHF
jgi:hypothetical protein